MWWWQQTVSRKSLPSTTWPRVRTAQRPCQWWTSISASGQANPWNYCAYLYVHGLRNREGSAAGFYNEICVAVADLNDLLENVAQHETAEHSDGVHRRHFGRVRCNTMFRSCDLQSSSCHSRKRIPHAWYAAYGLLLQAWQSHQVLSTTPQIRCAASMATKQ